MNIVTLPCSLRKFFVALRLTLLLTKPQQEHLASILISTTQGGFDGKIKNIPELSMRNIHRTSTGKFLSESPWPTALVQNNYQLYVTAQIAIYARTTRCPVYVIIDDTIAEKTKPSSKARRPIAGCGFHHSHLKGKRVYGHQILCVLLQCGDLRLPYCMEIYNKAVQSKIKMACNIIRSLPDFPTTVYVLADSWYSSGSVVKASRARNFEYIGALKANRVLYYPGGPKLGNRVKTYAGTLTKDDVHLVTVGKNKYWVHCFKGYIKNLPRNAKILISWPFDKLFDETAIHLFVSTEENSDTYILKTYTCRWRIEVFFRDSKMQLDLDNYQIRSKVGIERYLLCSMLAYAYCMSINEKGLKSLSESRRATRKELKQRLIANVYEQAVNGIPLSRINQSLGVA